LALTALPLSESFALAWEHDPALDRSRETFSHDYQVAVETLNWEPLCIPGQKPTLFHFRAINGSVLRRLMEGGHGVLTGTEFAFRIGLIRVENFEGCPAVKRGRDPEHPGYGDMAGQDVLNVLDEVPKLLGQPAGSLVAALGDLVIKRSTGFDPKS
jgi:hypothetical protein